MVKLECKRKEVVRYIDNLQLQLILDCLMGTMNELNRIETRYPYGLGLLHLSAKEEREKIYEVFEKLVDLLIDESE